MTDGEEKTYGGCAGPDVVKVLSSDGHEFIVKRGHALMSGTIKAMLRGPGQFAEKETNEVHIGEPLTGALRSVHAFHLQGSLHQQRAPRRCLSSQGHLKLHGNC